MTEPKSQTTIRMRRCGESRDLDGYIFADRTHAHQWLSQPFVDRATIELEEVQVGPMIGCPRCRGAGWRQEVTVIRSLTPDEAQNV